MRASFELVRREPALLWFPVISTCCLVVSAGFWIFEGAWLYAVNGAWFLYVPLVAIGFYSLFFVGIFFNVALAGAAAQILDGEETTVGDGLDVAWSRLGGIAGWAGYSLFVAFVVSFVKIAPLVSSTRRPISFTGCGPLWRSISEHNVRANLSRAAIRFGTVFDPDYVETVRRQHRRIQRAALLVPGLLFYLDAKLLFEGHVHSPGAKALLGFVLLCGFALSAAVSVVRQVFAVELYRVSTG